MSLVMNNLAPNFSIKNSTSRVPLQGALNVLLTGQVNMQNVSAITPATTNIPDQFILGDTIVVAPTTANTTFTLPSASDILNIFGKDINTGVPKLTKGDALPLRFINKGTQNAYLKTGTGGDGSAVILYNGAAVYNANATFPIASTGAANIAHITQVQLEFTEVNGSLGGATGAYTIYA